MKNTLAPSFRFRFPCLAILAFIASSTATCFAAEQNSPVLEALIGAFESKRAKPAQSKAPKTNAGQTSQARAADTRSDAPHLNSDLANSIENDDLPAVLTLLVSGANPNEPSAAPASDKPRAVLTPLARALAKAKTPHISMALLSYGANPSREGDKTSPAELAMQSALDPASRRALVDKMTNLGANPADGAGHSRDIDDVRFFLQKGVDPKSSDRDGLPWLFSVVGIPGAAKLLVVLGADPRVPDAHGSTVLIALARTALPSKEKIEIAEFLVSNGADPKAVDGNGYDVLSFVASLEPHPMPLTKALIGAGANPGNADSSGHTLLFVLVGNKAITERDRVEYALFLVSNGVDPSVACPDHGTTAADHADRWGQGDYAKALRSLYPAPPSADDKNPENEFPRLRGRPFINL